MRSALEQAKRAYRKNEVPVGCVIVDRRDHSTLCATHNLVEKKSDPTLHAEILAIRDACNKINSKNLSNCDIYVTLEPCAMCASAISHARIGRLYYGSDDVKHGAVNNGVKFYTSDACFHRPEIFCGIRSEESRQIMQSFFSQRRKSQLY